MAVNTVFNSYDASWHQMYELYKAFKVEFGREPRCKEIYQGRQLGVWVSNNRQCFKRGALSKDREQRLLNVGFIFDSLEAIWQETFELYTEFKERFGREPKQGEIYRGVKLGKWVNTQRVAFKEGKLSEKRIQKLLDVGFDSGRPLNSWQLFLDLYVEFKQRFGREPKCKEIYQGRQLGIWVDTQRQSFKKGVLFKEREQKLLEAGFDFGVQNNPWQFYFDLYVEFKQNFGREPKTREIYRGVKLGTWVTNQRQFYRKGKLPDNRKQKLLEVGFVF